MQFFCSLLQKTGSVVSGGNILNCVADFDDNISDVTYIYSTFNGAREIYNFFKDKDLLYENNKEHVSVTHIANLFLRITKIKVKLEYSLHSYIGTESKICVMIMKDRKDILNAVTNFDLSFSQVLFDGVSVKATYPDHIKSRSGHLEKDYIKLLQNFDRNIINRIMKYRDRGFSVSIDTPASNIIVSYDEYYKLFIDDISSDEFIANYMYSRLIISTVIEGNINISESMSAPKISPMGLDGGNSDDDEDEEVFATPPRASHFNMREGALRSSELSPTSSMFFTDFEI